MKKLALLLLLAFTNAFAGSYEQGQIFVPGEGMRGYLLYTPSNVQSPHIVYALSGGGPRAALALNRTIRYNKPTADAEGYRVVYGIRDGNDLWNDGRGLPAQGADDVAYLQTLKAFIDDYLTDEGESYLLGASNGGMMTLRMACESPSTFDGYAPIIANTPVPIYGTCSGAAEIYHIAGTSDDRVPYEGGDVDGLYGLGNSGSVVSAPDTIAKFAANGSCGDGVIKFNVGTAQERWEYLDCSGDLRVHHAKVNGGEHRWRLTWGFNSVEKAWGFFDN